jgi:ketosteroid isomerase-like protein
MRVTGYFFLLIITVVCAQPQSVKDVEAVLDSQAAAWNRGDIDGYMAGYWKSDSLLFTSGGNIQRGYRATLEKYKKSYSTKEKMGKLKFSQLEINLLSPEAAWVFGHWELIRKYDHPEGVFTLILRKFPEGWKIIHDHTSSSQKEKVKSQK